MRRPGLFSGVFRSLTFTAVLAALTVVLGVAALFACQMSNDETREQWQKISEIFQALRIHEGSSVADIGAGRGFFTVRLAREVGASGRVYSVDITSDNVRKLRDLAKREGLKQVEVIHGEADDPRLVEQSIDAALIINAYHEMRSHQSVLAGVRRALKPGARLVIVEPIVESRRDESRERQESSHEVAPGFVEADLRAAGFDIVELRDPFTKRPSGDTEWMIVATPTPGVPSSSAGETQRR